MEQKRVLTLAVMLILVSLQASATTVFGTVYDFSLKQADNVRVNINTTPQQQLIAVNGRYSFNVASGDYTIYAEQLEFGKIVSTASEEITIKNEGSYIRDIILFPYFEEEIFNDSLTIEDVNSPNRTNTAIITLLVFIVLLLVFIVFRMKKVLTSLKGTFYREHKKEKKNEPEENERKSERLPKDLQEIVDFIKSQENRVTQKDIRKQFPKSEAKISLLIADLEKKGIVEKIKKGRGNIILLKP